jgi:Uma2 family endonuclease
MTIASPISRDTDRHDPFSSQRFTLYNISWDKYESLLKTLGDQRVFLTYNQGTLELMSPSPAHEKFGSLLARLVQTYTLVLRIPIFSLAQTTWRRREAERGLEADGCFYVQNEPSMRHRREIDLAVDPPPDLAIEVDLSSSSVDKEDVYAGLGVPELWRYEDGAVVITTLQQGRYLPAAKSLAFPGLPIADVNRFVDMRQTMGETELVGAFMEWVERSSK